MKELTVRDMMVENPVFITMQDTLEDAAIKMKKADCGILPVGNKFSVDGMITDRDIVVRAIAKGRNPASEKIKDYMTQKVFFCNAGDSARAAAVIMKRHKISRLLVHDESGNVCGILSFGGILREKANADDLVQAVTSAVDRSKGRKAA